MSSAVGPASGASCAAWARGGEGRSSQRREADLLIPDILMCKSQRAAHRLPMRPLIAEMPRSLKQTRLTYICC